MQILEPKKENGGSVKNVRIMIENGRRRTEMFGQQKR
jgi:hypothetical protein